MDFLAFQDYRHQIQLASAYIGENRRRRRDHPNQLPNGGRMALQTCVATVARVAARCSTDAQETAETYENLRPNLYETVSVAEQETFDVISSGFE